MQNLPSAVQTLCETWNNIHTNEFPNIGSWVCVRLCLLHTVCGVAWQGHDVYHAHG